jgi:hypothetical protein
MISTTWYYTRDNVLVMVIRPSPHRPPPFHKGGERGPTGATGPRQRMSNYVTQTTPTQV